MKNNLLIKPIETIYNFYKMRSRLEARWSVFMDACDVDYEYEPERFTINGIAYLPDFYLPKYDYWLEIKPHKELNESYIKMLAIFAGEGHRNLFLYMGHPWELSMEIWEDKNYPEKWRDYSGIAFIGNNRKLFSDSFIGWVYKETWEDMLKENLIAHGYNAWQAWTPQRLIAMDKEYYEYTYNKPHDLYINNCLVIKDVGWSKYKNNICPDITMTHPDTHNGDQLNMAYLKARQARFEHGEEG